MKERENELTTRPNLTNLETGDIFMSDGPSGPEQPTPGPEIPKPSRELPQPTVGEITPQQTVDRLARVKAERIASSSEGITFPPEIANADPDVRRHYTNIMAERARTRETEYTSEGPERVTVTEKPTRKRAQSTGPRVSGSRAKTEAQPQDKIQQIKDAIEVVRRGETPINPATGKPLSAISQDHAIAALEKQLREAESTESTGSGGEPPKRRGKDTAPAGSGGEGGGNRRGGGEPPVPPGGDEDLPPEIKEKARWQIRAERMLEEKKQIVRDLITGKITEDKATELFATKFRDELEETLRERREATDPLDDLTESYNKTLDSTTPEEANREAAQMKAVMFEIYDKYKNGGFPADSLTEHEKQAFEEWRQKYEAFIGDPARQDPTGRLDEFKNDIRSLNEDNIVQKLFIKMWSEAKEVGGIYQPQCAEDFIKLIIVSEDPKWGHGESALIKEGEIQWDNFMDWVRSKIIYHTEFNPDTKIDLFQQIYIATPYRQIGLGEIINESGRYFRRKKTSGEYAHDDVYERFKDELLYETWLYTKNHNYQADYRQNKGSEDKTIETLGAIHFENIFTLNKDRMFRVLSMPSATKREVNRALGIGTEGGKPERVGGSVGRSVRQAELAYTYLGEIGRTAETGGFQNMFEKVLGQEGSLGFYKGVTEQILRDKYGKELRVTIENYDHANKGKTLKDREDFLSYLLANDPAFITKINAGYDAASTINTFASSNIDFLDIAKMRGLTDLLLKKTFVTDIGLKGLNFYTKFEDERYRRDMTRAGIINAIGFNYDLKAQDAKYADHWAHAMSYWSGISGRNDTDIIFQDSFSRFRNFALRQLKEESGRSGGGDPEMMAGLQMMALTMWEALRIKDSASGQEKSLLEVLQGGQGDEVNLDNDIKEFTFAQGSQQAVLAVNHYNNLYNIYKLFMEENGLEFDFDKHLKRDNHGRLITDPKLRQLVRERFMKSLRYAFDNPRFLYDNLVRNWTVDDPSTSAEVDRTFRVVTASLKELMFSDQIRDMQAEMSGGQMSKAVAAWTFSREMWKHRHWSSKYRLYSPYEFDMVEEYLRRIPSKVEATDMGAVTVTPYFSKEEFEKIRKAGKVERGDLQLESNLYNLGDAFYSALLEMLEKALQKTGV